MTKYFCTNAISGAWIGSFYVNAERWSEMPEHLQTLLMACIESGHFYRNQWYWGGEQKLRVEGDKLELTSIPDAQWDEVENAAIKFWDEAASVSDRAARVVEIFRNFNKVQRAAGQPYRCTVSA